jgi:hypothetical protein
VVVLGKRLKKNGRPELCLSERLAFAIDLFKREYQPGPASQTLLLSCCCGAHTRALWCGVCVQDTSW